MNAALIRRAAVVLAASCLISIPAMAQAPDGVAPPPSAQGAPSADARAAAMAAAEAKIKEAAALPTPHTADGKPDLSGYWVAANNPGGGGPPGAGGGKAVTPDGRTVKPIAGAEEQEIAGDTAAVARRKADEAARPVYQPQYIATTKDNFERASHLDPSFRCEPLGVPRLGAPTEIYQNANSVVLLYQSGANNNVFRVIPTDGRQHDPDADSMANGDAVGHYEGDTLVVDVVNVSTDTWLDGDGSFHDKNLRVTERFTRKGNTLLYEATVDDPTVFAKPFSPKSRTLIVGKPGEHAAENYPCVEFDQAHLTTNERH
jgi:hypothetical protein